jgi:hypothetical protein
MRHSLAIHREGLLDEHPPFYHQLLDLVDMGMLLGPVSLQERCLEQQKVPQPFAHPPRHNPNTIFDFTAATRRRKLPLGMENP